MLALVVAFYSLWASIWFIETKTMYLGSRLSLSRYYFFYFAFIYLRFNMFMVALSLLNVIKINHWDKIIAIALYLVRCLHHITQFYVFVLKVISILDMFLYYFFCYAKVQKFPKNRSLFIFFALVILEKNELKK